MNQYPSSQTLAKSPAEAKRIWYIDKVSFQSGHWLCIVQQSTSEYFRRTGNANGVMDGYLGRTGETSPYFESKYPKMLPNDESKTYGFFVHMSLILKNMML